MLKITKLILVFYFSVQFALITSNYLEVKRGSESDRSDQSYNSDDIVDDFTSTEVATRKNIESVIPVKRIPQGWVFRDELLAPWESNLPAVLVNHSRHYCRSCIP